MRWLKKENLHIDHQSHHIIRIENLKQCLENRKCITKQIKNKWVGTGVNVCEKTVRNQLNEMGFT